MPITPASTDQRALQAITARVTDRFDDLGEKMARRYRDEIVDYLTLESDVVYGDVIAISLQNLKALISNLESGEVVTPKELDRFRDSQRRFA